LSVSKIAATSRGRELWSFRKPSFTIHPVSGLFERDQCRHVKNELWVLATRVAQY